MMAHQSKRHKRRPLPRQSSNSSFSRPKHSEFQLISPLSDLSNPSFSAFHHRPDESFVTSQHNKCGFVLENLPHPDRVSKNRKHVLPNNVAVKQQSKPKIKNRLATCLVGGAHRLDLMRMHTTKAVKQTVKQAKKAAAVQHHKAPEQDVTLGMSARKPEWSESFEKSGTLSSNNKDSYFESLWREPLGDSAAKTPTIALDKAFEDALGFHRVDDYFNRLAELNHSPGLDQLESLASVNQEDRTCLSYLISESSQCDDVSLIQDGNTITAERKVRASTTSTVEQKETMRGKSPPKFGEEMREQKERNSHASSALIYSPETAECSMASASLCTKLKQGTTKDENCQSSVQPSTFESVAAESRPSSSENISPLQLMGELLSLHSDKYCAAPSTSPQSEEDESDEYLSASPKSESSHEQSPTSGSIAFSEEGVTMVSQGTLYVSVPYTDDELSMAEEEPTAKNPGHVHMASLASFSSLPVEQDTSAVPFEEAGVSAIAEDSMIKSQVCKDHQSCEASQLAEDNCSSVISSDKTTSESANNDSNNDKDVEEASLQEDDASDVIVAIGKLPDEIEEVSLQYDDRSDVIVAITKLPESEEETTESKPRPDIAENALPASNYLADESQSFDSSSQDDEMTQETEDVTVEPEESLVGSESYVTHQTEGQGNKIIKTAIATGRVFAPRGPGELLISVDLGDLLTDAEEPVELVGQPEATVDSKKHGENESKKHGERFKVINLVTNPKALQTENQNQGIELATTIASRDASGYASDIVTLREKESSTSVLDSNESAVTTSTSKEHVMKEDSSAIEGQDRLKSTKHMPKKVTRQVATMNGEQEVIREKQIVGKHRSSMSPCADSVASSTNGSPMPLVSEQALLNAAFLFSPSYAEGKTRLLTRAKPPRPMHLSTFAITTAESRNRLSTFSARSRPALSIPISSAPINMSSIRSSQSTIAYEGYKIAHGVSRALNDGDESETQVSSKESDKHVHFACENDCHIIREADTSRVALGTPVTAVSPPPIDRKISDLTEATVPFLMDTDSIHHTQRESSSDCISHRQRVAKILRQIAEDEETVEECILDNQKEGGTDQEVDGKSAKLNTSWTYREENGAFGAATPLRSNGHQGNHLAPTNSPMLRFKEAQRKFSKPAAKIPVRTSPTRKYTKPISTGTVHSRVSELNDRLRSKRHPARKNPRRETGGENVLAPRPATLEAPLFRNPIIMAYKDDSSQAPSEMGTSTVVSGSSKSDSKSDTGVSTVASADMKSDTGVSTVVSVGSETGVSSDTGVNTFNGASTVVSTDASRDESVEEEDIFAQMMGSPPSPPPEERLLDLASDSEDEDDAFADVRRLSDTENPVVGYNLRSSSSSGNSLQSLLARDKQARQRHQSQKPPTLPRAGPLGTSLRSIVSEDPSALTFDTEKENSVASRVSSLGGRFTDKAVVDPRKQLQHALPGDLCLSPRQKTPLQARRWRSLAAENQEKGRATKGSSKKGSSKKTGHLLKERSANMVGAK